MDKAKKEKLNKLAHLLAAVIILFHGLEKWEHNTFTATLFILAGLVCLMVAIFHHKLLRFIRSADLIFSMIEGLLAIAVAYDFIHEGKHYIQYMYFFAALAYFIRAIILWKKTPAHATGH